MKKSSNKRVNPLASEKTFQGDISPAVKIAYDNLIGVVKGNPSISFCSEAIRIGEDGKLELIFSGNLQERMFKRKYPFEKIIIDSSIPRDSLRVIHNKELYEKISSDSTGDFSWSEQFPHESVPGAGDSSSGKIYNCITQIPDKKFGKNLEKYFIHDGNIYAHSVMKELLDKTGEETMGNNLCLIGPHGVGKTALISWIMNGLVEKEIPFCYASAQSVLAHYQKTHGGKEGGRFQLNELNRASIFVFDGLERILSRSGGTPLKSCMGILRDMFESAESNGVTSKVILAYAENGTNQKFSEFCDILNQARDYDYVGTRISGATQIKIREPSDKISFIKRILSSSDYAPEQEELDKLVSYLVNAFQNQSTRGILGAISSLEEQARFSGMKMDYSLASSVLCYQDSFQLKGAKRPLLREVLEIVANHYGVTSEELGYPSRRQMNVKARRDFFWMANEFGFDLESAGKLVNRGRGAVSHSLRDANSKDMDYLRRLLLEKDYKIN